jgi:hypothetical protein
MRAKSWRIMEVKQNHLKSYKIIIVYIMTIYDISPKVLK